MVVDTPGEGNSKGTQVLKFKLEYYYYLILLLSHYVLSTWLQQPSLLLSYYLGTVETPLLLFISGACFRVASSGLVMSLTGHVTNEDAPWLGVMSAGCDEGDLESDGSGHHGL